MLIRLNFPQSFNDLNFMYHTIENSNKLGRYTDEKNWNSVIQLY